MSRFPDLESLAAADEEEVLKIWQGLGYYSRARNMLRAARQLVEDFAGRFPETEGDLRKLRGVGEYTAACLASVCFGVPAPAVDGNVTRVISRLFTIGEAPESQTGKRLVREYLRNLIDHQDPGDFNEAMMELGALICKPASPLCGVCPLSDKCKAYASNQTGSYPVRRRSALRRERWFHYLVVCEGDSVLIRKRTGSDVWQGLYDLPLIESEGPDPFPGRFIQANETLVHHLTHQVIRISFYDLNPGQFRDYAGGDEIAVRQDQLDAYPFPKPVGDYLNRRFGRSGH